MSLQKLFNNVFINVRGDIIIKRSIYEEEQAKLEPKVKTKIQNIIQKGDLLKDTQNINLSFLLTILSDIIQMEGQIKNQQATVINQLMDSMISNNYQILLSFQKYLNSWYFQNQFSQLMDSQTTNSQNSIIKPILLPINPFSGIRSWYKLSPGVYAGTFNLPGTILAPQSLDVVRYTGIKDECPLSVYLLKRFKYDDDKAISMQIYLIIQRMKYYSVDFTIGDETTSLLNKTKLTQSIWKIELPLQGNITKDTLITIDMLRMYYINDGDLLQQIKANIEAQNNKPNPKTIYQTPYYPYGEIDLTNGDQNRTPPGFLKAIFSHTFSGDDISFKVSNWKTFDESINNILPSEFQFVVSSYPITDFNSDYNIQDEDDTNQDENINDKKYIYDFHILKPKEQYWVQQGCSVGDIIQKIKDYISQDV